MYNLAACDLSCVVGRVILFWILPETKIGTIEEIGLELTLPGVASA